MPPPSVWRFSEFLLRFPDKDVARASGTRAFVELTVSAGVPIRPSVASTRWNWRLDRWGRSVTDLLATHRAAISKFEVARRLNVGRTSVRRILA